MTVGAAMIFMLGLQSLDPELAAAKQLVTDFAGIIRTDPAAADAMLAPDFQACDVDYCMGKRSVTEWPFTKLGCRFIRSAGASWTQSKQVLISTKWVCNQYGSDEVTALVWVKDQKVAAVNMFGSWE